MHARWNAQTSGRRSRTTYSMGHVLLLVRLSVGGFHLGSQPRVC